jgi:hypothetical protein
MPALLLETLLAIARTVGEAVLDFYNRDTPVEYKGSRDPITPADRRSNRILVEGLNEAFPGIPVVAEESDPASFRDFDQAPRVFFVDPLDGTREFIDRNDEFAVMIGIVEGPGAIAGVVYIVRGIPVLGTTFSTVNPFNCSSTYFWAIAFASASLTCVACIAPPCMPRPMPTGPAPPAIMCDPIIIPWPMPPGPWCGPMNARAAPARTTIAAIVTATVRTVFMRRSPSSV